MQIIPNAMDANSEHFLTCPFECSDCREKFSCNEDFIKHIHDGHKNAPKRSKVEPPVECPVCSVKFTQKNNLGRHMQRFHDVKAPRSYLEKKRISSSLQCPECNIKFTRRSNLIRHLQKFHKFLAPSKVPQRPKMFSCSECDTQFTKWSNCMRHMRNFHVNVETIDEQEPQSLDSDCCFAPEDLECVIEVDPFPVVSPLRTDPAPSESTEHEPNPVMQLCEHDSPPKDNSLTSKKRKYVCIECDATFSTPFNMRRHVKNLHAEKGVHVSGTLQTIIDVAEVKKCPLCEFSETRLNLYVHLNLAHGVQILIECHEFDSLQQFEEWRSQIKAELQSQFVDFGAAVNSDTSRIILPCSQLVAGSENFCPAEMTILIASEKCSVYFVKTHVGHDL